MRLKPGSILWLVAFDVKLGLRGMSGRMRVGYLRLLINVGILWLFLMHGLAWLIVVAMRSMSTHFTLLQSNLIITIVLGLMFLAAFGGGLVLCINAIFMRGDLDMLCTSPIPVRNIFTARGFGIAMQSVAFPAFFLFPIADVEALYGQVQWLGLYPVTLAFGLTTAALAMLISLLLVRAVGARSARTLTLVIGSLLGVSLYLGFELPNMLGKEVKARWELGVVHWLHTARIAQMDSVLWYPVRAAHGDFWPLLTLLVLAGIIFWAVTFNLQRGFMFATQNAAGVSTRNRSTVHRVAFNPQFWRVMCLKEWRMVYRSPQLVMQIFRLLVFLIPAAYILFRDKEQLAGNYIAVVAAGLVFIATMLASMLVWVSVCAEDAPEFLATVPRSSNLLRTTKMQVMLVPLWVIMLPAVIAVGVASIVTAFWLAVAVMGATLSIGVFHVWRPVPGARTQMRRAMRAGGGMSLDRQLPMLAIQSGWAGVAYCMPTGHWLGGLIALCFALAAPVFVLWRSRGAEQVLAY